jgi:hypothetical protein
VAGSVMLRTVASPCIALHGPRHRYEHRYDTRPELSVYYATMTKSNATTCILHAYVLGHHTAYGQCRCVNLHLSNASSSDSWLIPHRSPSILHVRDRMIFSTALSLRMSMARLSVLASRAKYRPEYGSNRSLISRSLAFASSICRKTLSGS